MENNEQLLANKPKEEFKVKQTVNMYSIKDNAAGTFGAPFVAPNDAMAKRMLQATMQQPKNQINAFAEDFELWKIGIYDEETAEIIKDIQKIANAIDFKSKGE